MQDYLYCSLKIPIMPATESLNGSITIGQHKYIDYLKQVTHTYIIMYNYIMFVHVDTYIIRYNYML